MKLGQEASRLGLASERYRISYRQLSESAPAPAAHAVRWFGTGRITLIYLAETNAEFVGVHPNRRIRNFHVRMIFRDNRV